MKLRIWQKQETALDPGYKDGKPVWAATNFDDSAWEMVKLPKEWGDMG